MKKYLFLLLSVAVFSLAQGRESNTGIEKIPGAYHLSKPSGPHTELQLSDQVAAATALYRADKKITDGNERSSTGLSGCDFYVIAFQKASNNLPSKDYLIHIYPSHHFW